MNQAEKRVFLTKRLLDEDRRYRGMEVPTDACEQKRMLSSLMNIRRPQAIDAEFLTVQDEYLRQEIEDAGITRLDDLKPVCGDLYLWQGDITRLQCGTIVNAANSLIKHNRNQIPKDVYSENAEGEKLLYQPAYSDKEEALIVSKDIKRFKRMDDCEYSDFAILYRTNAQSRSFEE